MSDLAITREGDRLLLRTSREISREAFDALLWRIKEVNGRQWDRKRRVWWAPATQEIAAEIYDKIVSELGARMDPASLELLGTALEARDTVGLKDASELPEIPIRTCSCAEGPHDPFDTGKCHRCEHPIRSWLHQRQAFHFARAREGTLLALGMGSGKSLCLVALAEEWECQTVVILAPRKPLRVWPAQFAENGVRDWIVCNHGGRMRNGQVRKNPSTKQRVEAAKGALGQSRRTGQPIAICVNYESAWREPMRSFLLSLEIDLAAVDEGHRIKAAAGKWSKFAEALGRRAKHRLDLTGTPRPHSEGDLYAQARFLDPGIFGTNNQRYLDRYFKRDYFGAIEGFVDEQRREEFVEKFASFAYVCETKDVIDLPPEQDLPPFTCELEPKARRHYEELETEFITWVSEDPEDDPVTAANALAKLIRLAQVASGHLPIDSGGERRIEQIGTEKRDLLDEIFEDLPAEPVVVFARFIHDLDNIRAVAEKRGLRYGEISGRRSDGLGKTESGEELATMDPNIDVCGTQIAAGGVGIDLTRARYALYYSLTFGLGEFLQSRARVHRPGQTRPVSYLYLIVENTIDEVIIRALRDREEVLNAVLAAVKARMQGTRVST